MSHCVVHSKNFLEMSLSRLSLTLGVLSSEENCKMCNKSLETPDPLGGRNGEKLPNRCSGLGNVKIKSLASLLSGGVLRSPRWIDHTENVKVPDSKMEARRVCSGKFGNRMKVHAYEEYGGKKGKSRET